MLKTGGYLSVVAVGVEDGWLSFCRSCWCCGRVSGRAVAAEVKDGSVLSLTGLCEGVC